MEDHKQKNCSNLFQHYNPLNKHTRRFHQTTRPHTPADYTVATNSQNLTYSHVIKHDFRKQTYIEDDKRRQMALLALGKKKTKSRSFFYTPLSWRVWLPSFSYKSTQHEVGEACSLSLAFAGMALEAA